ncbi:hypothetical protein [Streptosporangium vulgare]|uniref:hypothetical protein n=1 Tax=Streptosporangium vulgare TaxID=46190 RepID=UPI0031CDC297
MKDDHKTVEKRVQGVSRARASGRTRRSGTSSTRSSEELTVHAHIEEQIFYPAARDECPRDVRPHVLESVEEHHVVVWYALSRLAGLDPRTSGSTPRSRC